MTRPKEKDPESSCDEEPLLTKLKVNGRKAPKPSPSKTKAAATKKPPMKAESPSPKKASVTKNAQTNDIRPPKKEARVDAKEEPKKASGRRVKKEEEPEEVFRWWEQKEQHPDGQHWLTLEHNGVLFPPEYVPHGRPVQYQMEDGTVKDIPLDPDEEEVATMFAVMREQTRPPSDYYVNPVFRKNFFTDWLDVLNSNPERNLRRFGSRQHPIKQLDRVSFDAIWQWHLEQKEIKKALTKEQKAALRKAKEATELPNKFCMWDGKKQPVGNFRIEPPGLFRGRGKHPLMGKLKRRVRPEDIVINIGKGVKVPEPPPGRRWKEVRHDNKVTWLANWTENVCGNGKYVMLAASSMVKGKSDFRKFEKARNLGEIVGSIRESYRKAWKSSDIALQQRAVALYFIDVLALRCGHEKGEDEAETFGACSLKCSHINLDKEDHVLFDFLGKDSIRYYNEVKVEPEVHLLLKKFVKGKTPNSDLFDRVRPEALNNHLKELMPGLTAKVFRTFNASYTLDREIHESPISQHASLPEKIVEFNAANTKVALLCNHQRSVTKSHQKAMVQYEDKLACARKLLDRLLSLKEAMQKGKKGSLEKMRAEWEKAEDIQQRDWLEKYGTEEDKAQYAEKTGSKKPAAASTKSPAKNKGTAKKKRQDAAKAEESDDEADSDAPLPKKAAKAKGKRSKVKSEPVESADEPESDVPLSKKVAKRKLAAGKHKIADSEAESDSEAPLPKKARAAKPKAQAKKPKPEPDSDSDAPLAKKSPGKSKPKPLRADSEPDDDSDAPLTKKAKAKGSPAPKGSTKPKPSGARTPKAEDSADDSPPAKKKRH